MKRGGKKSKNTPLEQAIYLVHKYAGIVKLPQRLSKLQDDLFSTHVKVEVLMNKLIILKTLTTLNLPINDDNITKIEILFSPIIRLNFARKLKYIKDNQFLQTKDAEELDDLNTYRNEFAHSTRDKLMEKYWGKVRKSNIKDVQKSIMSSPLVVYLEIDELTAKESPKPNDEVDDIPF